MFRRHSGMVQRHHCCLLRCPERRSDQFPSTCTCTLLLMIQVWTTRLPYDTVVSGLVLSTGTAECTPTCTCREVGRVVPRYMHSPGDKYLQLSGRQLSGQLQIKIPGSSVGSSDLSPGIVNYQLAGACPPSYVSHTCTIPTTCRPLARI